MTTAQPTYIVSDNAEQHRFEIELGDGEMAIADYRVDGGSIAFTHTVVPQAYEGKGVGSALVRSALEAARERGQKVIPECAFFAAYIKRHADTHDLVAKGSRDELGLS